jgi:uncharacterized protein YraI
MGKSSMLKQSVIGLAAAMVMASAALADGSATTTSNLNIRSGPGTTYRVIGVIPAGETITVIDCPSGSSWCSVDFGGKEGWSSAIYLTGLSTGQAVDASTALVIINAKCEDIPDTVIDECEYGYDGND